MALVACDRAGQLEDEKLLMRSMRDDGPQPDAMWRGAELLSEAMLLLEERWRDESDGTTRPTWAVDSLICTTAHQNSDAFITRLSGVHYEIS